MPSKCLPVINLENLSSESTLRALDSACRQWGAFQIVNHGIDTQAKADLFDAMQKFFALPIEAKRRLSRSEDNPWGFYDRELTKNTRDWKQIFDYSNTIYEGQRILWPTHLPAFQRCVTETYRAVEDLAFKLLEALSLNIGMPRRQLFAAFAPQHSSFLRLNYYPICSQPERPSGLQAAEQGHLGINHHTDAGALTILLEDGNPGLEIYNYGQWHGIDVREDAVVVHLGDVFQVWSNDRYRAPIHRVVVNPSNARYSAPFFFNPSYATDYEPLQHLVDSKHPARYRKINWGEFRRLRATGDYANVGEEIQIRHYRI